MPEGGFWKLAVRRAIKAGGGIEAVAAAMGLSSSTVGRWNNVNDSTLPNRAQRIELDELSMACGGRAEILTAQAVQLNHVAFCLPQNTGAASDVTTQMMSATEEFGHIAARLVDALRDGTIDAREQAAIAKEIDDALSALVKLRALVVDDETLLTAGLSPVRAA